MGPTVSVVMNAHNTTHFLAAALSGVLNQTFGDFEVVIWDNASTDKAEAIAASFGDGRIRYIFTPDKVPLYEARCDAVRACHGEYVAFLDCDDLWVPDKLERQIEAMEETGAVAACSDYEFFMEGQWNQREYFHAYVANTVGLDTALAPYRVGMSCLIARRDVLLDVLPDPAPDWFYIEDVDIVSRLLVRGQMSVVHAPLMQYRIHGSNASNDREAYVREVNAWLANLATRPIKPSTLTAITRYYRTLSLRSRMAQLLADGRRREAFSAWRQMPMSTTRLKWVVGLMGPRSLAARLA